MSNELMMAFKKNCLNYNEHNSYVKKIVCEILGYDENHMYNQMIADLYDKCLKENYFPYIMEEFQISSMMEIKLDQMSNEEKLQIANSIVDTYIKHIAINMANGDYAVAVLIFIHMNHYMKRFINYTDPMLVNEQLNDKLAIVKSR